MWYGHGMNYTQVLMKQSLTLEIHCNIFENPQIMEGFSLCKNHYFTMPIPVPESQILYVPKIGAHISSSSNMESWIICLFSLSNTRFFYL